MKQTPSRKAWSKEARYTPDDLDRMLFIQAVEDIAQGLRLGIIEPRTLKLTPKGRELSGAQNTTYREHAICLRETAELINSPEWEILCSFAKVGAVAAEIRDEILKWDAETAADRLVAIKQMSRAISTPKDAALQKYQQRWKLGGDCDEWRAAFVPESDPKSTRAADADMKRIDITKLKEYFDKGYRKFWRKRGLRPMTFGERIEADIAKLGAEKGKAFRPFVRINEGTAIL